MIKNSIFFLTCFIAISAMEDLAQFKNVTHMKQDMASDYKSEFLKAGAYFLGALTCIGISQAIDVDTSYEQSKNICPTLGACGGIILLGIGCCQCTKACNEYHEYKRLSKLLKNE